MAILKNRLHYMQNIPTKQERHTIEIFQARHGEILIIMTCVSMLLLAVVYVQISSATTAIINKKLNEKMLKKVLHFEYSYVIFNELFIGM